MRGVQAVGLGLVTLYSIGLALLLAQFLLRPPGAGSSADEQTVYAVWLAAFVGAGAGPVGMWMFFSRELYRAAWLFALGPLLATGLIGYAAVGLRLF